MLKIFGVYTDGEGYGISNGKGIYWFSEGQECLDQDVDIGEGCSRLTDYNVSTHGNDLVKIKDGKNIVAAYRVSEKVVTSLHEMKKKLIGV